MKFRVVSAVWRRLASLCYTFRVLALALGSIFWLPAIALAAPLASETFESYATGPLSGQGGGTGWTGNWTAPGNVTRAEVVDTTATPMDFHSRGRPPHQRGDPSPGGAVERGAKQPALPAFARWPRRFRKPSTSVTWCVITRAPLGLAATTPSRCIWARITTARPR